MNGLTRRITLLQATAINMIDMVGIGPFVVIPLVIRYFNSGLYIWAWVFGAVIALIDGMIWSELELHIHWRAEATTFSELLMGRNGVR